ncbi:MAG: hypothetical protein ACI9GW_001583 [Halieaceae bacterium]|jgi:hypothetical protein
MKISASIVLIGLLMTAMESAQSEEADGDVPAMLTEGKVSLDLRYRYENVEQDGIDEDASASLLRSRLNMTSGTINGFTASLEIDNITAIGVDNYNSTVNGKTGHPVIADPEGTDLNQLWLKYSSGSFVGTVGRQRILHGNQRFLGGVAWRQNEQTYDGLRLHLKPDLKLVLDVAYIARVNRIFGPDDAANPAEFVGDSYVARADYTLSDKHKLTGLGYWLEFDPQRGYAPGKNVNNSTNTWGLEYSGKFQLVSIAAAWARQSDAGESSQRYSADYYLLELSAKLGPVSTKLGREVLGADNGIGFKTPLATLHKFQGWADKFLGTPGDGIEDTYVSFGGSLESSKWMFVYHKFTAESSSTDFGTELDLVWTWPANKHLTLQAKYAAFDSDSRDRYSDTDKLWLTMQLKM